jgi:hypothetical protein
VDEVARARKRYDVMPAQVTQVAFGKSGEGEHVPRQKFGDEMREQQVAKIVPVERAK